MRQQPRTIGHRSLQLAQRRIPVLDACQFGMSIPHTLCEFFKSEFAWMNPQRAKNILEAALLCAHEPLSTRQLQRLFEGKLESSVVQTVLEDLRRDWMEKGLELVEIQSGWRFQTRSDTKSYMELMNPEKPVRYSRAVLEVLAIIAYKQPVTRADIESIRGVIVSSQVMKTLEDRGWIVALGHRDTPGRPALWGTTPQFLADLGLQNLSALPSIGQDQDLLKADELQKTILFEQEQIDTANERTQFHV